MNTNETKEVKDVVLKVIGVGGAGNNAINLMLEENLSKAELIIANTDSQDLNKSKCLNKLLLGKSLKSFGAGGNPEKGRQCAEESLDDIEKTLENTDILIISAGLGGGTGTGASPVIAEAAKKKGILTIAIVNTPFQFIEGSSKTRIAFEGLEKLKKFVDAYIVLSNEKLALNYEKFPLEYVFKFANNTLKDTIKIIHDIIFETGAINLDFNDLREVLRNGNETIIGIGKAEGKERAKKAVENALLTPLFQNDLQSCKKMALLFQCDKKTNLSEIKEAKIEINKILNNDDKVQTFFGVQYIETESDKDEFFQVCLIASQINNNFDNSYYDSHIQNNYMEEKKMDMSNITYTHNQIQTDNYNNENNQDRIPDFLKA